MNGRIEGQIIDQKMLEYLNRKDQEKAMVEGHKKEMLKGLIKDNVYASL